MSVLERKIFNGSLMCSLEAYGTVFGLNNKSTRADVPSMLITHLILANCINMN
jgi:hypothetical protein